MEKLSLPGLTLYTPRKYGDHRGFFSETFNKKHFYNNNVDIDFVQDNHSLSVEKGTLRGLHYQTPPFAQDKLVRVVSGSILDVAVDIRLGSPTYGKYEAVKLSAENWSQLFVPKGFAHGFITLQENTEVVYKVSNYYSPDNDAGIRWDDPDLAIDWGLEISRPILSDKDQEQPALAEIASPFNFGEF